MNEILRFVTQVTFLPVTSLVAGMEILADTLRRIEDTALPGSAGKARKAGPDTDLGGTTRVKLVEYTVVAVGKAQEEIVDQGQTLVTTATDADAFEERIAREARRKHKLAQGADLRVYFNVLARFKKPDGEGS